MAGIFSKLLGGGARPAAPAAPAARPAPPPSRSSLREDDEPEGDGITAFFTADHRACDRLWAAVESAEDPAAAFAAFDRAMRRHFSWEEDVLFPAFEADVGMPPGVGPGAVMREEHESMRALLDRMASAAASGDLDELLDQGDTLLMLIGQHNQKEEGMLYQMAEMHLSGQWPALRARLA